MQRRHLLKTSLALPFSALGGLAQASAIVGQAAPDFSLRDTRGKTVSLSDFKGKYVVLEWTNPGCPFVRKHYGAHNMQSTQAQATARGVVWLAINSTEVASNDYLKPDELGRWMIEQKATPGAILMDEDGITGRAYNARTTPHMYIVNPQGVLIYAGGIDSIPSARVDDIKIATNYIRQGLDEALSGKSVSAPLTKAYGCSIKYKF